MTFNTGDFVSNLHQPHLTGTVTRVHSGYVEVRLLHDGGLVTWAFGDVELIDSRVFYRDAV